MTGAERIARALHALLDISQRGDERLRVQLAWALEKVLRGAEQVEDTALGTGEAETLTTTTGAIVDLRKQWTDPARDAVHQLLQQRKDPA